MKPDQATYGQKITAQRYQRDVYLVFSYRTQKEAAELLAHLSHQLQTGVLFLSLTGVSLSGKS